MPGGVFSKKALTRHHEELIAYVMGNSPRNREQAIDYLDQYTRWREFDGPPAANIIEIEEERECSTD